MPIGFLTAAERGRLNRFPAQIPADDLLAFFQLSEADHTAINQQREDHTRLGFALQLCALRYLGFAPDDLRPPPTGSYHVCCTPTGYPAGSPRRLWPPDSHADHAPLTGPSLSGVS